MELLEAECKFRVADPEETRRRLLELGAVFVRREEHCDTYLRHPSKNFQNSDEALRIREIDGQPFVTYKGPRLEGPIKIRPEIELPMVAGTMADWLRIWKHLGFEVALAVKKSREVFELSFHERPTTITLDHVNALGDFAEVERIVSCQTEIDQALLDIQELGVRLHLLDIEQRSYLGMLLAIVGSGATSGT